ncbi:MAG: cupin domain-containing protein [Chitinophagaceae bacterium]|nr:MAG: cupin domain-containing protein [Chitinophagaceae bacterium]
MERRKFLLASLLAAPFSAFAKWTESISFKKNKKAFIVRADESRFFGKNTASDANFGRCIISSADTDNQLYIAGETKNSNKKRGGPGLHIHHQDDEIFYVVSGEFLFQLGEEIILGKAGDTVFVARGLAHTYANPIDNNPGELLIIHQPISPSLEKFYEVFSKIGYMNEKMLQENFKPDVLEDLMKNNAFVGPPIDIDAAMKKLKG